LDIFLKSINKLKNSSSNVSIELFQAIENANSNAKKSFSV
jgi:hypothetical protein